MRPAEIFVDDDVVYIRWTANSALMIVRDIGVVGEQFSDPRAERVLPHDCDGECW